MKLIRLVVSITEGSANSAVSLAADNLGNPVLAWQETNIARTVYSIYVKRWTGTTWTRLGGALDMNVAANAEKPSLALDNAGNPVISWQEDVSNTTRNVYVKRWTGTTWVRLGGALNIKSTSRASDSSLALDSSGNPVVSWSEYDVDRQVTSLHVKRWTGTRWLRVGSGALNVNPSSFVIFASSLAVDSSGNPVVSWSEIAPAPSLSFNTYVKRWNGSSWVQLGETVNTEPGWNAFHSSIAVDASGNPVVGFSDSRNSGEGRVFVKRLTSN